MEAFLNRKQYLEEPEVEPDYEAEEKADPFDFERHLKICSTKRSHLHSSDLTRKFSACTLNNPMELPTLHSSK